MRLTEINMSPSKLAVASELSNATVGLEFELIVKDFGHDPNKNFVPEPNFFYNERIWGDNWIYTQQQIVRFFCPDFRLDNSSNLTPLETVLATIKQVKKEYDNFLRTAWNKYKKENFADFVSGNDPKHKNDKTTNLKQFRVSHRDIFLKIVNLRNWLDDHNLDTMQSWATKFNFVWPYLTVPHRSKMGPGSRDFDVISRSFSDATGIPVLFRMDYHGESNPPDKYVIEPDGSLETQQSHSNTDFGLEFVSPPMSVSDMIKQIHAVKKWAIDGGNAYTNSSCGLHMNVSLPGYNLKKLDYVKLAVFLGDDWVSAQFGRLGHEYCTSAIANIKRIAPNKTDRVINHMKKSLILVASKLIHSGETEKYVTINTYDNRVEFRAPGGNWLEMDINRVIAVMQRCVVALSIAMDPEKYKKEYSAKLFKLISPERNSVLDLFTKYQSKQITLEQLKKAWASARYHNPTQNNSTAKLVDKIRSRKYYILYDMNSDHRSPPFSADTYDDALDKAQDYATANNITHWEIA